MLPIIRKSLINRKKAEIAKRTTSLGTAAPVLHSLQRYTAKLTQKVILSMNLEVTQHSYFYSYMHKNVFLNSENNSDLLFIIYDRNSTRYIAYMKCNL